jgi:hypothetical protein
MLEATKEGKRKKAKGKSEERFYLYFPVTRNYQPVTKRIKEKGLKKK